MYIAVISLISLLIYYIYFFLKLSLFKHKNSVFDEPISIIICAKDELDNLRKNLPYVLNQNYNQFEVIIVNDQSIDGSIVFLKELEKQYDNLVIVNIDDFITHNPGKKFALTLGIKTAKYEYLLLSDADCKPTSDYWVKEMCNNFSQSEIVLGFGSYERKKGFLNNIIRFDTFNVAQQYLSYALNRHCYMGVGRNLAYKRSVFFKNKGFANHVHIASGDDDLFIQEVAGMDNVSICISETSHTQSEVTESWRDWVYQKRRHMSAAPLYRLKFKILLTLYPLSQLLFWFSILLLTLLKEEMIFLVILLCTKLLASYLINYKSMKRLKVIDLYWIHPFYEVLHILVQVFFVLLNLFSKPKRWSR